MAILFQMKQLKVVKRFFIFIQEIIHQRTTEACEFRDHIEDFNQLDVDIYGISADSKKKHQNFIKTPIEF